MAAVVQSEHSVSEHSVLAPSSAYQWVYCAGSLGLQRRYPERDNDEARAGDASHWVASSCLTTKNLNPEHLIEQRAPNNEEVTPEIAEAAQMYIDDIRRICTDNGLFQGLQVEQPVTIDRVHPQCWGTPDANVFDKNRGILYVWDYKYGWGIVEAFENWQTICYAIGLIDRIRGYGNPNFSDEHIQVCMRIVQPRPPHEDGRIRTWTVRASDLRTYANILHMAAHRAMEADAKTTSGPHCRYCSARHVCPAYHRSVGYALDVTSHNVPNELPPAAIGAHITELRRAKDYIMWMLSAREEQALTLVRKGGLIPGYAPEHGRGRLTWTRPKSEIAALGDLCGVDVRKPVDVLTPTQAMKEGMDESMVQKYSKIRKTDLKLVPESEKAKKVFAK